MATVVTIAGTEITYEEFKIDNPLSPLGLAPTAQVTTNVRETISQRDPVTITIDGTVRFDGVVETPGAIRENGSRKVECKHPQEDTFEESVTFEAIANDSERVLSDALAASTNGAASDLTFVGASETLLSDYSVEGRTVKRVFRDMMDRTGRVWWVDPVDGTITVAPLGDRGTWRSLDATTDKIRLKKFDPGRVDSVRNDVTVNGTGEERVTGSDDDPTSISEYGRQSETINVEYIITSQEAENMAEALIVPDPLADGKITVSKAVGDVTEPLPNYTVGLDDPSKGISETGLVVEKQTITQGKAELQIGEGAGANFDRVNRRAKSDGDVTEPGSVYGSDRIADDAISNLKLQNGVVTSIKLADGSVLESKVDTDAITETKIRDGSIVTPKLEANAVQAPKIDTSTITGSEFDRIVDGEVVDTQNIISLLADKVIFADTGDTVDGVTTSEGGTTVIQGGKIETGSLTADQIDTLNLDADQITIEGFDSTLRFEVTTGASGDFYEIYASGNPDTVILGGFKSRGGAIAINSQSQNNMNLIQPFDGDNAGSVGESGTAYAEMHAHNFITASPDPIQSVDCDSLCDIDWYDNPPEPVQKRARDIGDSDEEVPDGRDHTPVELGTMANYLLETCKSQQRRIESLEERLDALERQNA